jgi:hypothetical protein
MDISTTTAPRSDQQNFDDYISGPKTVTITEVRQGNAEQPVEVHLVEFPGRPYKPSKSMRRVLIAAWGPDSKVYAGRRMTLVGDPTVKFGGSVVGGIKISHLSHIDKRQTLNLTVTKGKRAPHTVEPLADAPAVPTEADVQASTDTETLRSWWKHAHLQSAIKARVDELKAEQDAGADPVEPDLLERGE